MSSVLGHGLAGMSVWALARRAAPLRGLAHRGWMVGAAAAGCLPDLDSLVGLPHRGPTHTLGFALGVAALASLGVALAGRRTEAAWLFPVAALVVWLHPGMDLLSGGGPPVELLAPFWGHRFEPVPGGLPLHSFTHNWSDLPALLADPWTLRGMLVEAALLGPLFAATRVRNRYVAAALALTGAGLWAWRAASGTR